jgi:hypothetical protein
VAKEASRLLYQLGRGHADDRASPVACRSWLDNLRDILAALILKQTVSYEQASYAIQDTPGVVQQDYGRFLPRDKAALAARILNQVWEAA